MYCQGSPADCDCPRCLAERVLLMLDEKYLDQRDERMKRELVDNHPRMLLEVAVANQRPAFN